MRINESKFRRILKEETRRVLREGFGSAEPREDDRWVLADLPDDLINAVLEDPEGPAADRLWDALVDTAISSGDFGPDEARDEATAMLDRFMRNDFLRWERERRGDDRRFGMD